MLEETLGLSDAKRMLAAAESKAESLGVAYNVAVVDAGGHLIAFVRQDRGLIGSIDLAIKKALRPDCLTKAQLTWRACLNRVNRCSVFIRVTAVMS